MQMPLHRDIAAGATVNLLPLAGSATGEIHERDVLARLADPRAERGVRLLIRQAIGLRHGGRACAELGEASDAVGTDAGRVEARAVKAVSSMDSFEQPFQLRELQRLDLPARHRFEFG